MENPTPQPNLKSIFETVKVGLAVVTGASFIFYILGYVIVNTHFLTYGLRDFSVNKPAYLKAGILFVVLHLLVILVGWFLSWVIHQAGRILLTDKEFGKWRQKAKQKRIVRVICQRIASWSKRNAERNGERAPEPEPTPGASLVASSDANRDRNETPAANATSAQESRGSQNAEQVTNPLWSEFESSGAFPEEDHRASEDSLETPLEGAPAPAAETAPTETAEAAVVEDIFTQSLLFLRTRLIDIIDAVLLGLCSMGIFALLWFGVARYAGILRSLGNSIYGFLFAILIAVLFYLIRKGMTQAAIVYGPTLFLLFILWWGRATYHQVGAQYGGGQEVQVNLILKSDTDKKLFTDMGLEFSPGYDGFRTACYELLDETDEQITVVAGPGAFSAVTISKELIVAVKYHRELDEDCLARTDTDEESEGEAARNREEADGITTTTPAPPAPAATEPTTVRELVEVTVQVEVTRVVERLVPVEHTRIVEVEKIVTATCTLTPSQTVAPPTPDLPTPGTTSTPTPMAMKG